MQIIVRKRLSAAFISTNACVDVLKVSISLLDYSFISEASEVSKWFVSKGFSENLVPLENR